MFMNVQDTIEHETNKVKIIDMLVFLNCLENNDEDNWPQGMCATCVSTALMAYNFKLNCLKVNSTISQILTVDSSPNMLRSDLDSIDINVVYQDHEYDVPLFNHNPLDLEANLPVNKELTPLPPVSEITSAEHPPRQEGEKKYSCTFCSKSFTRIFKLRYHMAKHSEVLQHLCYMCGKAFHTADGLNKHLISHKDVAQFKCGFCNKTYKRRQSLKEHFRVAHSSNRKLFACDLCGKRYSVKSTLLMHRRVQHEKVKYPCEYCPKTFTRASYLKTHTQSHLVTGKPRPFLCNFIDCDRSYSTKHSLLVHIAYAHTTKRPHVCDICKRGFATASGLKYHRTSHISSELYCNYCSKSFSNKRIFQKHIKTHDVDASDMILETVVDNVFFDQYDM
ncbi:gastrula zinc finger protein XlCGF57.1-like [Phthorimaea operculella]|nr:gastrula zinc finger protein XlCGF57.1-like [Phthorimaea operculella]